MCCGGVTGSLVYTVVDIEGLCIMLRNNLEKLHRNMTDQGNAKKFLEYERNEAKTLSCVFLVVYLWSTCGLLALHLYFCFAFPHNHQVTLAITRNQSILSVPLGTDSMDMFCHVNASSSA